MIERSVIADNQVFTGDLQVYGDGVDAPSRDFTFPTGGGGLYIQALGQTRVLVKECSIRNNLAGNDLVELLSGSIVAADGGFGGGVFIETGPARLNGANIDDNEVRIVSTTVSGNIARHSGGGLFLDGEGVELLNCTIAENFAEYYGGGIAIDSIFDGIGEVIEPERRVKIRHSTIANNEVSDPDEPFAGTVTHSVGGGIFADIDSITLDHTIVASNIDNNSTNEPGPYRSFADYTISPDLAFKVEYNRLDNDPKDDDEFVLDAEHSIFGDSRFATLSFDYDEFEQRTLDDFSVNKQLIADGGTNVVTGAGLGELSALGGPVLLDGSMPKVIPLLANSPAIDTGKFDYNSASPTYTLNGAPVSLAYDQRGAGFLRVYDVLTVANTPGKIDIGTFEFQPSTTPLVGDYDRNGQVNCFDYYFWRANFNAIVSAGSGADGSGNGIVDDADFTIWADAYFNATGLILGDYNGDGRVTMADYNLWRNNFGSTNSPAIDGNCNGIIDTADYVIWRDHYRSEAGAYQFGLLNAAFGPDVPPEVVGVMLTGNAGSTFDFVSVVGSGEQLRSIRLSGTNKISLTFNQPVTVAQSALTLQNLDGSLVTATSFVYEPQAQTASWTYPTTLNDGRYLLRLSDTVVDVGNEALDGEFTSPWSLTATNSSFLPSGNKVAGGEFRFRFTVLAGDSDHNNIHDNGSGTINYTNWKVTEPGMIYASNITDEFDTDLSFGDVSLREAVNYANTQSTPTRIELPAGRFTLSRNGTESTPTDVAFNDLDVTGNVQIVGAGPGLTIIDKSALLSGAFEVSGLGKQLKLAQLTVANGSSATSGQVAWVTSGATMQVEDAAIVNHTATLSGTAISVTSGSLSILRSVFSNNDVTGNYGGAAIYVSGTTTAPASVTVGESIFAQNVQPGYYSGYNTRNGVRIDGTVTKTNLGKNLFDSAAGGFFDTTPGVGDYLGTPTYVVMSAADTFNHADNLEALSLREAVDLANTTAGSQEIWLPAWKFTLTRDRATYGGGSLTDLDAAFGDLDVKDSLIVRGVSGRTSIGWKPEIVDEVFDLWGDYNKSGQTDYGSVSSADFTIWQDQLGLVGAPGQFSADGDNDGDVDQADYNLWSQYFGKTLGLFGVSA